LLFWLILSGLIDGDHSCAQREPVVLSPQEYDRLRAINTEEFERFCDQFGDPEDDKFLELAVNAAADDGRRSSARLGRISRHSDHDPTAFLEADNSPDGTVGDPAVGP
jgi:hypothetical protein